MTLTELTVTVSLLLIVSGAMFSVFEVIQRTNVRQEKRSLLADEMRVAMQQMTKEIRQAQAVRTGSDPTLLDIDTYINGVPTRIRYQASGTSLTRTVGTVTKTTLTNMTSTSVFTYSPGILNATDITITLRARPLRFSTDPTVVELVSQVRLRNRR